MIRMGLDVENADMPVRSNPVEYFLRHEDWRVEQFVVHVD